MKKKLIVSILLVCAFQVSQAQELYFLTGKNFTTYDFKNSKGASNPNLNNGTGNFFELGFAKPSTNEKFIYSVGLSLNEYNNMGGNSTNIYSWDTQYIGLQGGIHYSILKHRRFQILPKVGLNLATIISGRQMINGNYFDLTKEKEFSGILFTPSIGLSLKYKVSNNGFFSFGYNYCNGFNLSNSTDQKLSFNTNQLQFGLHYEIK